MIQRNFVYYKEVRSRVVKRQRALTSFIVTGAPQGRADSRDAAIEAHLSVSVQMIEPWDGRIWMPAFNPMAV